MTHGIDERERWIALIVLCLGVLMIALDTTIVYVALPSLGVVAALIAFAPGRAFVRTRTAAHDPAQHDEISRISGA